MGKMTFLKIRLVSFARLLKKYIHLIFQTVGFLPKPWGLSTLAKEFTAAACIMQISSNDLSTLVSGKV